MKPEAPGPGWSCSPVDFVTSGSFGPGRLGVYVVAVDVLTGLVGEDSVGTVEGVSARGGAARGTEGGLVRRRGVGGRCRPVQGRC